MVQRFILGIITVILAIVIGVSVYNSFKERNQTKISGTMPLPTQTASKFPSVTATQPSQATVSKVKLFFVKLNDNGQSGKRIGCGDSIIAVNKDIAPSTMPLTAAYQVLLTMREQYYGESRLYNPLYQSDITLESAEVGKGGTAIVKLKGTQAMSGVCDDPRLIAQLQETALQFPSVTGVQISINGYPIEQLLSGKGQ
ncbi:MAG: GerMN domain-containing protein [Candidatus Levybacteria bacterium]|nr:GerMN domain-containing protein [Candidatus Levybacteria bacterium]